MVVRENGYRDIVMPSESKGICIVCGKKGLLGDELCCKCWDGFTGKIIALDK
jgi:hypothetical protein